MFTLGDNVQDNVVWRFRQQPKEFSANEIWNLVHQWDSCLNACGDFFNCRNTFTCKHFQTGFTWTCFVLFKNSAPTAAAPHLIHFTYYQKIKSCRTVLMRRPHESLTPHISLFV
jgi:hypothetical protein